MYIRIELLDRRFQRSEFLSEQIVREYQRKYSWCERVDPIEVYSDGDHFWLFNGFHRVVAAERAGVRELNAVVYRGTYADMQAHWRTLYRLYGGWLLYPGATLVVDLGQKEET